MTSPAAADLRFATVSWLHPTTGECHTATLTDGHLDDATERAVAALPAAVQPHYRQFLAWKSGAAALHPRANLSDRTAQAHAAFQAWKACPHRGNHLAPLNDPPTTCTCTDARVLLEFCDLKGTLGCIAPPVVRVPAPHGNGARALSIFFCFGFPFFFFFTVSRALQTCSSSSASRSPTPKSRCGISALGAAWRGPFPKIC